jgi:hypothetical protein
MAVLARMDLDSIRDTIAKIPVTQTEDEDAFRRLANQIITGRTNKPSGH